MLYLRNCVLGIVLASVVLLSGCKKDDEIITINTVQHQIVAHNLGVDELFFLDANYGIRQNYYTLSFTSDGGATWTNSFTMSSYDLLGFSYTSRDTAYAFYQYTSNSNVKCYRTIDRGVTWTLLTTIGSAAAPYFYNNTHGICISRTSSTTYSVYKTTNSGQVWASLFPCPAMRYLFAPDVSHFFGWVYGGPLQKSNDGGINWTDVTGSNGCEDVVMLPGSQRGFFINNSSEIYSSTDYGATWSLSLSDPAGATVHYIDADESGLVVAVGDGALFISKDFGANWKYYQFEAESNMQDYRFNCVQIIDASTIILAGRDANSQEDIFKVTAP